VPLHSDTESNAELADRVKSILATKRLTLHQASQISATLFGRGTPYYLHHNLYYDLSPGHFSPSLFQLVAFSRISDYRLRDWLRVFGFHIEEIPRLQIQLRSKRTAFLESSLDDRNLSVPWFQSLHPGALPTDIVPLAHLLEWTEPRRLASLSAFHDGGFLYAQIGSEDALAFPELLPGNTIFTVVFANGFRQACVTGNAVDFIRYPPGKSPKDVVAVIPHEGRRDDSLVKAPEWYWCLYSEALE